MNKIKVLSKYHSVEKSFFRDIKNKAGSQLLLYCVTGSLTTNNIIPGWSDIDVMLVFENYNKGIFDALNYALNRNKTNIKIGTTFFSFFEFTSSDFYKDPKTHQTIELIYNGLFRPRVINKRIKLHKSPKNISEWFERVSFTEVLCDLRRKLITYNADQEKAILKNISTLIKIILFCQSGNICLGYKEIFDNAKKHLSGFIFNFKLPSEILATPHLTMERRQVYINFLNWLANYPIMHNNKTGRSRSESTFP